MLNKEAIKNKIIAAGIFLKTRLLLVVKSEIIKIGAIVFISIILLTAIAPIFFNSSSLKFHVAQKVSQTLGSNITINGDVKIALLPYPKITANEVVLQNYKPKISELDSAKIYNFYAKSVEVIFPIFNFSKDVSIKEIIFSNAILESHFDNLAGATRQDALIDILNKSAKTDEAQKQAPELGILEEIFSINDLKFFDKKSSEIPEIIINNGQRIIYDFFGRKREIKAINGSAWMNKNKLIAEGNFSSDNVISNFNIFIKFNSTSKKPNSFIEITSPVLNFKFAGNFISENKFFEKTLLEHDFNGKITADIAELKSFYKSYIDNVDVLSGKLKFNGKPINISAEVTNAAFEGLIKNLTIKSNLVEGVGEINLSTDGKIPLIDINLTLENLDLDGILSNELVATQEAKDNENINKDYATNDDTLSAVNAENQATDQTETKPIKTVNLDITKKIKDFDLTAEIKVKKAQYLKGQITDGSLYLTISNQGEVLIMPLIFNIPGDGIVRLNGAIDSSTATPKLLGKIDATGKNLGEVFKWLQLQSQNLKLDNLKNYNLYSDLLLLPNSLTFNNFYLGLNNNETEVSGELKIDNGGKVVNSASRFRVTNFDVKDYFFISSQSTYLSPGLLLKKLLWLNNLSSNNDFNLTFDKLIYDKEIFPNQILKLRFGHGYFDLYDANLQSEKTALKINFSVDISDQNPRFELKIDSEKFDYQTPQQTLAGIIDDAKPSSAPRNFFDQFYALPSLEEFNGKISLNFANLNLDDVAIKNLKLSGNLKDGNIANADLACDLYDGNLTYKGLLGLKINKTINGNLAFGNVSIKPILSDIFGIKNISGVANFSANATSVADSKNGFLKSLTSEVKFIVNTPSVVGYGLTDLIKKMFAAPTYQQELQNPEKILTNSAAITSFKQAKGSFAISGGQGGKIKIDMSAPAVNAILSGGFEPANMSLDALFNAIFLTGNSQKQTPINIAASLKGKTNNIAQSTNLDQVRQYLGLAKVGRALDAAQDAANNSQLPTQIIPTQTAPKNQIPQQEKSLLLPSAENSQTIQPAQ